MYYKVYDQNIGNYDNILNKQLSNNLMEVKNGLTGILPTGWVIVSTLPKKCININIVNRTSKLK